MNEIQGYRAEIKHGDAIEVVYDEQPEIFVAKVLEKTGGFSEAEDAPTTELRVDAIPRSQEAAASIVASVRSAIAQYVDTAKMHLKQSEDYLTRFGPELGQAAIASWKQQSALDPANEVDRLQAMSPEGALTILEGASSNWGQELQDRLRDIGVLSVGKPTPPLDTEALKLRFGDTISGAAFDELAEKYAALPDLSDVVEDANIRRLCSALTTCGFETRYSCEGHGYELAHVKFVCSPEDKDELQQLLDASRGRLNEDWSLVEDKMDDRILRYRLQPSHQDARSTRHNRVIADLDVIGMLVLQQFAEREAKDS